MKVFIAIPCMDTLSAKFAQCLVNLVNHKRDFDVEVGFHIGSLVYDSRNKLAERAINSKNPHDACLKWQKHFGDRFSCSTAKDEDEDAQKMRSSGVLSNNNRFA